jgi:hypothetical protein
VNAKLVTPICSPNEVIDRWRLSVVIVITKSETSKYYELPGKDIKYDSYIHIKPVSEQ